MIVSAETAEASRSHPFAVERDVDRAATVVAVGFICGRVGATGIVLCEPDNAPL